jgi:hypothetical protein
VRRIRPATIDARSGQRYRNSAASTRPSEAREVDRPPQFRVGRPPLAIIDHGSSHLILNLEWLTNGLPSMVAGTKTQSFLEAIAAISLGPPTDLVSTTRLTCPDSSMVRSASVTPSTNAQSGSSGGEGQPTTAGPFNPRVTKTVSCAATSAAASDRVGFLRNAKRVCRQFSRLVPSERGGRFHPPADISRAAVVNSGRPDRTCVGGPALQVSTTTSPSIPASQAVSG